MKTKLTEGQWALLRGVVAGIGNVFIPDTAQEIEDAEALRGLRYFESVPPPMIVDRPGKRLHLYRATDLGRAALGDETK